eukprot:m.93300 g.93300  ORF g.93300 m.93300 type:complete len:256 (-) comp26625_c0_seq1:115-882(-)
MSLVAIVTGASRGFGRSVCKQLAKAYGSSLQIIMVARSASGLMETAKSLEQYGTLSKNIVEITGDLGDLSALDTVLDQIFASIKDPTTITNAFLVNNAGSLGDLSKNVKDFSDIKALRDFCDFNLVSCMALTARFLKVFDGSACVAVNVSSLLAVKAFAGWGMYAMAKAGRDMFHAVVAAESKTSKSLNFAPGPLDTDMQKDVRETICDESQKKAYTEMHTGSKLVDPDDSASKLIGLLKANTFETGAHIDYYDL